MNLNLVIVKHFQFIVTILGFLKCPKQMSNAGFSLNPLTGKDKHLRSAFVVRFVHLEIKICDHAYHCSQMGSVASK